MATIRFKNKIDFTYQVEEQGRQVVLRGEFIRGNGMDKLGVVLEVTRPTMEETVDDIHRYARVQHSSNLNFNKTS
jgi:hypothetical protein